jgi:hypothetical protein
LTNYSTNQLDLSSLALLRIVAQGFHEPNDGIDEKRTLNDGIDEIIPKNRQT